MQFQRLSSDFYMTCIIYIHRSMSERTAALLQQIHITLACEHAAAITLYHYCSYSYVQKALLCHSRTTSGRAHACLQDDAVFPPPPPPPSEEQPSWTQMSWDATPLDVTRRIFCNRSLNMRSINAIGQVP